MGISNFFYSLLLVCIAPSAALHLCRHANYTSATFESNLNKVLENLANNTSSSKGFNTSVSGQSPDRVYGLLQCWGDSTVEDCFSCSQEAISSIRQDCGNVVGGKAWFEKCFIRYENFSFFGRLDTETNVGYSSAKVTVKPEVISTAVNGILRNLSYEALRSPRRYSSASVATSTSYKISSLVQCWSDLTSVEDCRNCLTNAISFLLDVTQDGTFQKAVAGSGSCVAQYERERNTLFDIRAPPPPLQLPSPPLSSPTPSGTWIHTYLTRRNGLLAFEDYQLENKILDYSHLVVAMNIKLERYKGRPANKVLRIISMDENKEIIDALQKRGYKWYSGMTTKYTHVSSTTYGNLNV